MRAKLQRRLVVPLDELGHYLNCRLSAKWDKAHLSSLQTIDTFPSSHSVEEKKKKGFKEKLIELMSQIREC